MITISNQPDSDSGVAVDDWALEIGVDLVPGRFSMEGARMELEQGE